MEEEKQIVIGIRGQAKQGRAAAIMLIVLCSALIFFGLFFGAVIYLTGGPLYLIIILATIFVGLGVLGLVISINNLKWVNNNDSIINTPVLIYDKESDSFIGYDCRHDNIKIVIKNGNIKGIRGSAVLTGRELFITYLENDELKKRSFGFCRNIDNGVFRHELNKYHEPKL